MAPPDRLVLVMSRSRRRATASAWDGEGLVGLDHVHLVHRHAGLLHDLDCRVVGAHAHEAGSSGGGGVAYDRASGFSPRRSANSREVTTSAAAASLTPEALPAVTVPSFLKAGFSCGQPLQRGLRPRMLLGVEEKGVALPLGDGAPGRPRL